jgi:DNA-binding MarR family transcriptional regulator
MTLTSPSHNPRERRSRQHEGGLATLPYKKGEDADLWRRYCLEDAIIRSRARKQELRVSDPIAPPPAQYLREDAIRGGMDLLFFAHRSHLRHADEELARFDLGRAHHRCLYFIARRPGLPVGELLSLLSVTKQSLGRVLNALVERGFVEQRPGERDRRQRLLSLTDEGAALEQRLFDGLHANMSRAYAEAGEGTVRSFWYFMQHLMCEDTRQQFGSFHTANLEPSTGGRTGQDCR